ncbi:FliH/SctL family protein [Legionella hackeliae]|uniref:Flagellar assembly protein FliH n=1 Tax=Legionella hackeliae TaxID=449 RepID=A0A0A8UUQ6_LEGHA|nr:FliH/SctL family protein [Legionella hackeliae]KTD15396.1 polar flagellar assembly protein FliH [Legionella hackeliae]CEK11236.1 Flagellar assembly protein FliH [Legionella hackeliae]STX48001.1 flagellar assembly protein FliH [Legionella hackeliae]
MDKEFQPLYQERDKESFDIWELQVPEPEPIVEVDPQKEFEDECERLREEARQQGYQEGMQQAALELETKRQELLTWFNLLKKPVILLDKKLSYELVQTITWICETCIGIELSIHPEKILILLEEIKKELPALQGDKQLLMNPMDVQYLRSELNEQEAAELKDILVADEKLERGDFYLKSDYSELDGRLKTRLQEIFKKQLMEASPTDNQGEDSHNDML